MGGGRPQGSMLLATHRAATAHYETAGNPLGNYSDVHYAEEFITPSNRTGRQMPDAHDGCDKVGNFEAAERMLSRISCPDVRQYTAYLKALLLDPSNLELGMSFVDHMSGRTAAVTDLPQSVGISWEHLPPVPPNLITMRTLLAACRKNYTAAVQILNRMKEGQYGPSVQYPDEYCYNHVMATCETSHQAKEILQEMRMTRRRRVGVAAPTAWTVTLAMGICRKTSDVRMARYFIKQAGMDGIEPDVYMYSAAIAVAEAAADAGAARHFWDEMVYLRGIQPNAVTYNCMLGVCAACKDVDAAVELFQEMTVQRTHVTFKYIAILLRSIKDPVLRLVYMHSIIDAMEDNDWKIGVGGAVIEILISTYGALGCYEDARALFDRIDGPANAGCLRAVLFACSTAQPNPKWNEALELLHSSDILAGTWAPMYMDPMSVSHTMIACSKANEWEESMQLLRLYGNNQTSILAFNSLIGACGRCKRPDVAIHMIKQMETVYGIKPDHFSFRNAIIACNQAEHEKRRVRKRGERCGISVKDDEEPEWWKCSLSLLRTMNERNLKPDIQAYSSVISACEAAGEWQYALSILQTLLDKAVNDTSLFNLYCFNAAISACEKGGAWVEALEIYEKMNAYGGRRLQPSVVTLNSLILALDNAGQKELAQSKYDEGRASGVIDPWRLTRDSGGNFIRAFDLHRFNAAMARAAVRSYLEYYLARGPKLAVKDDLVIIVGRGKHSFDDPVLAKTVRKLLRSEYGLEPDTVDNNPGRLVVSREALQRFIAARSWR